MAAPPAPSIQATGTVSGQLLGTGKYGDVWVAVTTSGATAIKGYTSPTLGGSYTQRSGSAIAVTNPSPDLWLVHFTRPLYTEPGASYGGDVYLKCKATNGDGDSDFSAAVALSTAQDRGQVLLDKFDMLAAIVEAQVGDYVTCEGAQKEAFPSTPLLALSYMYKRRGGATYLGYVSSHWNYFLGFNNADDLLVLPIRADNVSTYSQNRSIGFSYIAQKLLRAAGATTLANEILVQCDAWAQAMLDHLTTASCVCDGISSAQDAWQATHSYALYDVVRATSDNGRQYYCTAAGQSAASEPTWPNTNGGTVSDGGCTWKEDTVTANTWADLYDDASPYAIAEPVYACPNQMLGTALAYAFLYKESASALHNSASAKSVVDAILSLVLPLQRRDGGIFYVDEEGTYPHVALYDTLYQAYALYSGYLIQKVMGAGYNARFDAWLARGLAWLTNGYSSEPSIGTYHSGNGTPYPGSSELGMRHVAYILAGETDPLESVRWSGAVNRFATDRMGWYQQNGVVDTVEYDPLQFRFLQWQGTLHAYGYDDEYPEEDPPPPPDPPPDRVWTATIVIDGGAASTDDNDVTLTISCHDQDGDPPDEMRFAEGAPTDDPASLTWGSWEPYATSRAWQLAAQDDEEAHPRRVGVEFRNV